ncbi:Glutathione synthetase [Batrachochytrium dendrobatidis]|nr:Glutathione synthetase [Batrachochytrium dendrobatidis]
MDSTLKAWPPTLPAEELKQLISYAVDWTTSHGLVMRARNVEGALAVHVPFALFPSPYPKDCYDLAWQLQPLFNELVDKIARDEQFIQTVMESIADVDDFTHRLYVLYKETCNLSPNQKIWMALNRSDYLLHQPSAEATVLLQQVELNTISSAFAGLSSRTSDLHHYLANRTAFFSASSKNTPDIHASDFPKNESLSGFIDALAKAWEVYNVPSAAILMIVQPDEHNIYDQRLIEYGLFEKHGIPVIRCSLGDVLVHGKHTGTDRRLIVDSKEIAVVYYRAGYGPGDYISEKEWTARHMLETSMSIKCPPVVYQLAGTKKMQQYIATAGVLEKFVTNPEHVALLRSSFTGLYPLDETPTGMNAYERALKDSSNYVMKPQREGGGNNIYSSHIREHMLKFSPSERKAYILMDLIKPPPFKNTLVRNGVAINTEVVSELGIYGAYISDGVQVHMNQTLGHLLRTKMSSSDEGGVAAGYAVLDSPFLQ